VINLDEKENVHKTDKNVFKPEETENVHKTDKTTSHLNSLNTKKTTKYNAGYTGSGLSHAQECGSVKPVNGIVSSVPI
jgi:hypothetical protein